MNRIYLGILSILICLVGNVYSQTDRAYTPGQIMLNVSEDFFDCPKEVYGVNISVSEENKRLEISSVIYQNYQPEGKLVESEEIVSYRDLQTRNPSIYRQVKVDFSEEMLNVFAKYGVNQIRRSVKNFDKKDMEPHLIRPRRSNEEKLVKRPNYNRNLILQFDVGFDAVEVADAVEVLEGVINADPAYLIEIYASPNDYSYQMGYQFVMETWMMDFERAWDIIKGEDGYEPITIAYMDTDFTNADIHPDLANNLNPHSPADLEGTIGEGHGTEVASIANAVTDNYDLIAGGTWNTQFMPFVVGNTPELITALETVRDNLDDLNYDNDCYVINMSIGAQEDIGLENICNELYNDYAVLLVAAEANNGLNEITYPAGYESVIAVGSSDISDNGIADGSNWGDDIEILASGESIYLLSYTDFFSHTYNTGNSFASPFISSACALILSTEDGYNTTNEEIRNALVSTGKEISDNNTTYSRLNAYNALKEIFDIKIENDIIWPESFGSDDYIVFENPIAPNVHSIIVDGVTLYLGPGSVAVVEQGVRVEAINGGYIDLHPDAKIILEPEAEIIAGDGGFLVDNGAEIIFQGDGSCLATNGGVLQFSADVSRVVDGGGIIAGFESTGTIELADNVNLNIDTESKLQLEPGITLKLGANAAIKIDGEIQALGSSASPITFQSSYANPTSTEKWDRIYFSDTASDLSKMEHCIVEDSRLGVFINNASPTLDNCELKDAHLYNLRLDYSDAIIRNCTIQDANTISGIYARYSDPLLENNSITGNKDGVYLYNSNPDMYDNEIYNNDRHGIYSTSSSSPSLGKNVNDPGNNSIYDNKYGIYASSNSTPFLGLSSGNATGGWNRIFDNKTRAVKAIGNSHVQADVNWWGQYPVDSNDFETDANSTIDVHPALSSDPNGSGSKTNVLSLNTVNTSPEHQLVNKMSADELAEFVHALILIEDTRSIEAFEHFQNKFPQHDLLRPMLVDLTARSGKTELKKMISMLSEIHTGEYPVETSLLAADLLTGVHLRSNDMASAIANATRIAEQYPESHSAAQALFDLYHMSISSGKETEALAYRTRLEAEYPDAELTLHLAELEGNITALPKMPVKGDETTASKLPEVFVLEQNYPNPFNPETVIGYQLPQAAPVKLTVYNVLGQEVVTLVNEKQSAGSYTLRWNAIDTQGNVVPSGMYIYRITAGDYVSQKKMVLLQ